MTATKRTWGRGEDGKPKTAWGSTFYTDDGQRHRKSGFKTKKLAEDWEREERRRLVEDALAPKLKSENMTVSDLCQHWLDATEKGLGEREAVERTSWNDYELSVRLHIKPRIGSTHLRDLTAPGVVAFRKTLLSEVSRDKAQRVLKHFRQACNFGVESGFLPANPAVTVRIAKSTREHKQVAIPTRTEMSVMLGEVNRRAEQELARPKLQSKTWVRFAAMLALLQGGGLRISEARGLAWDAVDLEEGTVDIRQRADKMCVLGPLKSRKAYRQVVVGPLVIAWLKRWKEVCYPSPKNLVFCTKEGLVQHYHNIYADAWSPLCRHLKLVDPEGKLLYGLHDARHFRVSEKIAAGANLKEIMDEIGHATSAMTLDTYGHLFPEDLAKRKEQARLIEEKLGHILGTP